MSRFLLVGTLTVIVLGLGTIAFGAGEEKATDSEEKVAAEVEPGGFVLLHDKGASKLAGAFGAALAVIGAAGGISRIGVSACESIARQPEAGARIATTMLISAAMIEGAALLGIVVVCLLAVVL